MKRLSRKKKAILRTGIYWLKILRIIFNSAARGKLYANGGILCERVSFPPIGRDIGDKDSVQGLGINQIFS
jgi:hypothetical protein